MDLHELSVAKLQSGKYLGIKLPIKYFSIHLIGATLSHPG